MAKQMSLKDAVGGVSPDDFLMHYNRIRRTVFEQKMAAGPVKAARKAAKTAGVRPFALALMERLAGMDPDTAALELKQLGLYANLTNQKFAAELPLFQVADNLKPTEKTATTQQIEDAEHAGRLVGAAGEARDANTYAAGSELFVAWDRGWENGHVFWERCPVVKKEKKVTGRGRGRPPKKASQDMTPAPDAAE
jgi:hypothetical protein